MGSEYRCIVHAIYILTGTWYLWFHPVNSFPFWNAPNKSHKTDSDSLFTSVFHKLLNSRLSVSVAMLVYWSCFFFKSPLNLCGIINFYTQTPKHLRPTGPPNTPGQGRCWTHWWLGEMPDQPVCTTGVQEWVKWVLYASIWDTLKYLWFDLPSIIGCVLNMYNSS